MKATIILKTFLAIFIITSITSCKKTTTEPTPDPAASGAFTYKVDGGATLTVDSANAILYNRVGFGRTIDVYAFRGGYQVFEFHFAPTVGLKDAATNLLTYNTSPVLSYDSQSGSMNVITCDTINNKLIGDFNFIGKLFNGSGTKNITEGHMVVTKLTRQ